MFYRFLSPQRFHFVVTKGLPPLGTPRSSLGTTALSLPPTPQAAFPAPGRTLHGELHKNREQGAKGR